MKALMCNEFGPIENLRVEEVPDPVVGDGQVIIDVKAASVNFPDVLIVQNLYQFKPELPFAPGTEVAGVISDVGPGVQGLAVGDRVFAAGQVGGFAEKFLAPAVAVTNMPASLEYDEAASLVLVYGTSHHALKQRAEIKPGETLLVLGAAGGVGLAAVEIGKAMGARVIAAASSQEKVDYCIEHGADDGFVYERNPLDRDQQKALSNKIKEMTGGRGADVIYDPVGGEVFDASLRAINFEGRILVIGFAGGTIPQIPANIVMVKNVDILGLNYGSYRKLNPDVLTESFRVLMEWYREGKIKPFVSETFSLEETAEAISHVMERRALGKVVVLP